MIARCLIAAVFAVAVNAASANEARDAGVVVAVDHHQHLLSPRGAAFLNAPPVLATPLPDDVRALLQFRSDHWNDAAALEEIYAADAVFYDPDDDEPRWLRGAAAAATFVAGRFAAGYHFTPLAFDERAGVANLSAYYSRGEGADARQVGYAYLRLVNDAGRRKIAVEHPVFPGPRPEEPIGAAELIAMMDEAGIGRAVVLSVAYWFAEEVPATPADYEAVRAENDWTAAEAAKFPRRLVAFCSVNPLQDHAVAELQRCADDGRFEGLKLHFGSANVDLLDPAHAASVRALFARANAEGMPIVVHARGTDDYGARHARVLLDDIVPAAPDVPVQIAHLWGGANFSAEALEVYAAAVEKGEPAAKNLIFDVTDAALAVRDEAGRALLGARMRQIGLDRIYYGSDMSIMGHADARGSWEGFRNAGILTAKEYDRVARNVAPYLD
jgi:predicted TIM-barrel fold metal-dependent hydrolase